VEPGSDSMPALMACLFFSVMLIFATFFAFKKSVAVSWDPHSNEKQNLQWNNLMSFYYTTLFKDCEPEINNFHTNGIKLAKKIFGLKVHYK
jgi:hypothetical protein